MFLTYTTGRNTGRRGGLSLGATGRASHRFWVSCGLRPHYTVAHTR